MKCAGNMEQLLKIDLYNCKDKEILINKLDKIISDINQFKIICTN